MVLIFPPEQVESCATTKWRHLRLQLFGVRGRPDLPREQSKTGAAPDTTNGRVRTHRRIGATAHFRPAACRCRLSTQRIQRKATAPRHHRRRDRILLLA